MVVNQKDYMLVVGVSTILYQSRPGDSCEWMFSAVKWSGNLGAIRMLNCTKICTASESIIAAGEHSFNQMTFRSIAIAWIHYVEQFY